MAEPQKTTVKMEDGTIGYLSPNHKPPHLREVEEDAVYNTTRRIEEAAEERDRQAAKARREAERQQEADEARVTNGLGPDAGSNDDKDKKGK